MRRELSERELTEEGPRAKGAAKGKKRTVTVNLAESPLSWLHARGHIDDRLFDAGERLRSDYERAQVAPGMTMRWDPVRVDGGGGDGMTPGERQLAARARFDAAMAQAGSGLKDVLWHVVCNCGSLSHSEKGLGWPARSGKLVLRLALDRVADFYRIR
ncbi:hypothetical protein GRI34_06610 [Erythrobacter aquimaris]|uniref:DUF6456 domain-containing protein n=1 Tax=Qipengyuania aquimaris TaxID=255984 RepID=A0A6I4TM19_9SPHN|nr:DUF6456 domain-containing protein [Qipengyuania aquimaris]MXO96091.1 hypothetical protein [Qipengyuania aquimaris]